MIAITGRLASGSSSTTSSTGSVPMKERLTIVTGEKGAFVADTATAT